MNFTREPIIETIITPREGFKLSVRSSKGGGQEEYFVDAVEVVSFGHSFFFRCLEKPKPFLVPASDYEIVETKETRVVLKNVNIERSIKIGGGREASVRGHKEAPAERAIEGTEQEPGFVAEGGADAPGDQRFDKKRDRRRHRRRRPSDERQPEQKEWAERPRQEETSARETQPTNAAGSAEGGGANDETQVSSSMFSKLFPPPPTLISETIGRYKDKDFATSERNIPSKPVEDPEEQDNFVSPDVESEGEEPSMHDDEKKKHKGEEENPSSESHTLHRVSRPIESQSFSTSYTSGGFSNDSPFMS